MHRIQQLMDVKTLPRWQGFDELESSNQRESWLVMGICCSGTIANGPEAKLGDACACITLPSR